MMIIRLIMLTIIMLSIIIIVIVIDQFEAEEFGSVYHGRGESEIVHSDTKPAFKFQPDPNVI